MILSSRRDNDSFATTVAACTFPSGLLEGHLGIFVHTGVTVQQAPALLQHPLAAVACDKWS